MSTLADLFEAGREDDGGDADFSYRSRQRKSKKPVLPSLPAAGDTLGRTGVRLFQGTEHIADLMAVVHHPPASPASTPLLSLFNKDQSCFMSNPLIPAFFDLIIYEPSPPPDSSFEPGPQHFSPTLTFADLSSTPDAPPYFTLRFKGAAEKLSFATVLAVASIASSNSADDLLAAATTRTPLTVDIGGHPVDAQAVAADATVQLLVSTFMLAVSLPDAGGAGAGGRAVSTSGERVGLRIGRAVAPLDTPVKVSFGAHDVEGLPSVVAASMIGLCRGGRRVTVAVDGDPGAATHGSLPLLGWTVYVCELARVKKRGGDGQEGQTSARVGAVGGAPPPPLPPAPASSAAADVSADALFAMRGSVADSIGGGGAGAQHSVDASTTALVGSAPPPAAAGGGQGSDAVGNRMSELMHKMAGGGGVVSTPTSAYGGGGGFGGVGGGGGGGGVQLGSVSADRLSERLDRVRYEVVDTSRSVSDVKASVDGVSAAVASNHAHVCLQLRQLTSMLEAAQGTLVSIATSGGAKRVGGEGGGGAGDDVTAAVTAAGSARAAQLAAERECAALRDTVGDLASRCKDLERRLTAAMAEKEKAEGEAEAAKMALRGEKGEDAAQVLNLKGRVGQLEEEVEVWKRRAEVAEQQVEQAKSQAAVAAAKRSIDDDGGGADAVALAGKLAAERASHEAAMEESRLREVELRAAHSAQLDALERLNAQLEAKAKDAGVVAAAGVPVSEVVASLKELASSSFYEFEDAINSLPAESLSEAAAELVLSTALPILRSRARAMEAAILVDHPQ